MRSALSTRLLHHLRKQNFVQAGDRVAVAVSGGADSVALLHLMLELRLKLGIVVSVAHFNHQLRGRASDADEKFVAALAAKHRLTLHSGSEDVAANAKRHKANLEDTARRARYDFFDQLFADGHATKVAVAHTADDQAETVLAHIMRGTGLAGLSGIHPTAGNVFRPLLSFRRAELRSYLRARKQTWREDKTNRDATKTRARIRSRLIPLLESFQPTVVNHLANLAELAREDEAYLQVQAELRATVLSRRTDESLAIKISELLHCPPKKVHQRLAPSSRLLNMAMTKRIIRLTAEKLKPRAGQLTTTHVQSVLQLAERGENGKSLRLPGGLEIRREHDSLIFHAAPVESEPKTTNRDLRQRSYNIDFPALANGDDVALPVPYLGRVFRLSPIDWPAQRRETIDIRSVLDRDALRPPLVLRSWRPGDVFRPSGHRKAHKLKRLLNRKRIPGRDRDGWPVLSSGGVLAWARGFPVAAEFAAGERTRVGILIAEEQAQ